MSTDTGQSGRLRPIIVPPMFGKDFRKWDIMQRLWSRALTALRQCERVVVIGLSLREADYQTRWLLRTALAAAPRNIEIDVVNPSSEDRNRLRGFFLGLGWVFPYESIDKFLDERPTT